MPLHNDDDETMMVAQGTYALTKSQKNRKRKYLRKMKMLQVGVPSVKMVVECGHGGPSARLSDSEPENIGKELQVGVPPVRIGMSATMAVPLRDHQTSAHRVNVN